MSNVWNAVGFGPHCFIMIDELQETLQYFLTKTIFFWYILRRFWHIRHFCFDFCSDQGRGAKLDQSDCPISPGNFKHTIVQKIITVYVYLNMLICWTMNLNINILAYNVQQIFSINYNFTYTLINDFCHIILQLFFAQQ